MTEASRYCDIVMKGGIASGIVYPTAMLALARRYRFKSIGGTSAGAIAAAALAAAALGERRRELEAGWQVPPEAGLTGLEEVARTLQARGFIQSLFQPAPGATAAYALMVGLAKKPGWPAALVQIATAALRLAPLAAAATALVLLGAAWLIGGWRGALGAALPAFVCALLLCCVFAAMRIARLLRENQLGLCSGLGAGAAGGPALTEWLHQVIQSLSGMGEAPLTFDQLWAAPRYPGEPTTRRALQLAVITTDISHHEPRTLPFEHGRFWFCEEEFRRLFPAAVVDSMLSPEPIVRDGRRYHLLPKDGALPVLVATRMSLSFPFLLSAVPLYEADHRAMRNGAASGRGAAARPAGGKLISSVDALAIGGEPTDEPPPLLRVCWFSDGGIASNFPIHLFDAALPRWPTFAINLTYPKTTDQSEEIFLPTENNQGWQRVYSSFAASNPLKELTGFLFAIVATMQNWRDLLQSRAPGHRDRIVHVALGPGEGGMNLDMPAPVLEGIARKGTLAGETLVRDFDFDNHWWIRWRNAASGLERYVIEFATGAGPPISSDYAAAHASAATGEPPPPSYRFKASQRAEAQRRFHELRDEGAYWADHDPDLTEGAPRPLSQLRITTTF